MWNDERDLIMELLDEKEERFPRKCPCCGKNDGHVFFYRHNENERLGSAWAWCSNCQEFSHSRSIIPNWWKNMKNITLDQLSSSPENLDNIKISIDEWINLLKEKK